MNKKNVEYYKGNIRENDKKFYPTVRKRWKI